MLNEVIISKNCAYCGNSFEAKATSRKVYCSGTCKTYASQERTGKREAVARNGGVVEPINMQDINVQLQAHHQVVRAAQRKAVEAKARYGEYGMRIYKREEKIELLQYHIDEAKGNENDIEGAALQITNWNNEIKKLESEIRKMKTSLKGYNEEQEYWKFISAILDVFRAKEARNDFYKATFFQSKTLTGDEIARFGHYVTKYPFGKIPRDFYEDLGNLEQPFIFAVEGGKGSGKTIFGVAFAKFLMEYLKPKILFITEPKEGAKVVQYFKKVKLSSDLLTIKLTDSSSEITEAVRHGDFEFLFIDNATSYNLNSQFLKSLQKLKPKLSIFPISNKLPQGILSIAYARVHCKPYSFPPATYGSEAILYIHGRKVEPESGNAIFILNNFRDKELFQITL